MDSVIELNHLHFQPKHIGFMYCCDRENTFNHWPTQLQQKPSVLARNGFFYTGVGDRVTCFYCNVTLKQWEAFDDVEMEHMRWGNNCLFAKMMSSHVLLNDITF